MFNQSYEYMSNPGLKLPKGIHQLYHFFLYTNKSDEGTFVEHDLLFTHLQTGLCLVALNSGIRN